MKNDNKISGKDWKKLKLAALQGLLVGLILSPFLSIVIIKLIQQL